MVVSALAQVQVFRFGGLTQVPNNAERLEHHSFLAFDTTLSSSVKSEGAGQLQISVTAGRTVRELRVYAVGVTPTGHTRS